MDISVYTKLFVFVYMGILHVHAVPAEGVRSPATEVKNVCELHAVLRTEPGPLEEQPVL